MSTTLRLCLAIAGLALTMFVTTGCQLVDEERLRDDQTESIPWNNRADWEGGSLGAPF